MNKIIHMPLLFIFLVFMLVFFLSAVIKLPNSSLAIAITGVSMLSALITLKIFFRLNKEIHFIHVMDIILNIGCICLIFLFIFIEYAIVSKSDLKDTNKSDFIIVLGAALNGKVPSYTLSKRLETALMLINQNKNARIILSGGQGPGEDITEAEGMKRYLVSKGVNEENIIKEEKATNTYENILFSSEIIRGFNMDNPSITVVTSNFHMYRTMYICKKLNLKATGYASPILRISVPLMYFREFFAVVKTYLFTN